MSYKKQRHKLQNNVSLVGRDPRKGCFMQDYGVFHGKRHNELWKHFIDKIIKKHRIVKKPTDEKKTKEKKKVRREAEGNQEEKKNQKSSFNESEKEETTPSACLSRMWRFSL